uniref:UNC93-like protein 3 n=1 Tax=Macrostomum lignano TaxID=282301 RepID=A0A1I8FK09_9PLAT
HSSASCSRIRASWKNFNGGMQRMTVAFGQGLPGSTVTNRMELGLGALSATTRRVCRLSSLVCAAGTPDSRAAGKSKRPRQQAAAGRRGCRTRGRAAAATTDRCSTSLAGAGRGSERSVQQPGYGQAADGPGHQSLASRALAQLHLTLNKCVGFAGVQLLANLGQFVPIEVAGPSSHGLGDEDSLLSLQAFGMLLNGFLNSVLTSIERRFDLQSVEAGMIASTYDIGACLAIVPITYYGRLYRRSRFISVGAFVVATGSFLFSSPYFIAGNVLCDGVEYPEFCVKQNQNYFKWVFWAAQLLHGMGGAPFFTLAVSYLDDNLSIKESGVFLASGYLLGGIIVNIYVDLDKPRSSSPRRHKSVVLVAELSAARRGNEPPGTVRRATATRRSAARPDLTVTDEATFYPQPASFSALPTFVCLTLAGTGRQHHHHRFGHLRAPKTDAAVSSEWRPSTATLTIGFWLVSDAVRRAATVHWPPCPQLLALPVGTAPYPETQFVPDMDRISLRRAITTAACSCVRNKFMFDAVVLRGRGLHSRPASPAAQVETTRFSIDWRNATTQLLLRDDRRKINARSHNIGDFGRLSEHSKCIFGAAF